MNAPARVAMVRALPGGGPYRIRALPDDSDEQRVVDAFEEGRRRSVERVRSLLGGFRIDEVDLIADSATMALLDVDGVRLGQLDLLAQLDVDLLTADLPVPRLRLANGTVPAPVAEELGVVEAPHLNGDPTSVEPFATVRELINGTTVVLNNIAPRMRGPIRRLSNDLSRVTNTRVQINAYISEREAAGFGRHWDDHDVLILQVTGRKHWEVFAPAVLSPIVGHVDGARFGESVFSTVLEPGMGLFIPRGWGHQVRGFSDEMSVHVTCGMRRMSGLDVLRGLIENDARRRAPSIGSDCSMDTVGFASLGLGEADVDSVYGAWRARSKPQRATAPLRLWAAMCDRFEGVLVSVPLLGAPVFVDRPEPDPVREIALSVADSNFAMGREWVEAFASLASGDELSVDDIVDMVPGADAADAATWIMELGQRSVLTLVEPERD